MTPTWAVVLIGLGAGLLGTLARASYERNAELRTRMLDAADDFSTGTMRALQQARNAAGTILKDKVPLLDPQTNWYREEIHAAVDALNDEISSTFARLGRVHLLFGDDTPTGIAASGVAERLRIMTIPIDRRPDSLRDHESMSDYSKAFDRVLELHASFNRAARSAITASWGLSTARAWVAVSARSLPKRRRGS